MPDGIQEALEKLKVSRSEEPQGQPKDDELASAEDVPEEEAEPTGEAEALEELEALESEGEPEGEESEESGVVFDIDGTETSLADILEWKAGHMKDADYRRKTQEVAESRKAVEAKDAKQDEMIVTLQAHIDMLGDMTDAEFKDIDWDQLREDDTAEYLRLKERREGKQGKLNKAKSDRQKLLSDKRTELANAEQGKLFTAAGWEDQTKHSADIALIQSYLDANAWSNEDFGDIINHKHMMTILDAAKYHELKSKAPATKKKVKKAPTVVKGRTASVTGIQRQIGEAEAKLKLTGHINDAMALRRLKRQLT